MTQVRTLDQYVLGLFPSEQELEQWSLEGRKKIVLELRAIATELEGTLSEHKVQLIGYGSGNKIELLKWVRRVTGSGLKEAKAIVYALEHTPFEVYASPEQKDELIERDLARIALR